MDNQEQIQFFYEIFDPSLPRLGPGNNAATHKALDIILSTEWLGRVPADAARLQVLDLGCGNGTQTLQLAQRIDGTIVAVDNHAPFLNELKRRAKELGVLDMIRLLHKDMAALRPEDGLFDLVWSEGALYSMGFSEGLAACHRLLVPHGRLAVTELCWLQSEPPAACHRFFADEYPAMMDVTANIDMVKARGYRLLEHFTLSDSAWWDAYYGPLENRLTALRKIHASDSDRVAILDVMQLEIDIYKQYGSCYGYVFFLMQKD